MQVGFNHIPPATLATIGLNVAIYLKVGIFDLGFDIMVASHSFSHS